MSSPLNQSPFPRTSRPHPVQETCSKPSYIHLPYTPHSHPFISPARPGTLFPAPNPPRTILAPPSGSKSTRTTLTPAWQLGAKRLLTDSAAPRRHMRLCKFRREITCALEGQENLYEPR
ncbi:hypothetical protein PSPO01_07741 [Paraphaeosphaeria sporulosa]